jgi:hypothetical protein
MRMMQVYGHCHPPRDSKSDHVTKKGREKSKMSDPRDAVKVWEKGGELGDMD